MKSTVEGVIECSATLLPHPTDGACPVTSIDARVRRTSQALLDITYSIRGDLRRIRIPSTRDRRIAGQLWQHTCCELFLRTHGAGSYHEFNFSPSGEWAAYAFGRYREGRLLADATLDPGVRVSDSDSLLELHATVGLTGISGAYAEARLALGISAVIEARDGVRSYWALTHPAVTPDFHHPGAFAMRIDAFRN